MKTILPILSLLGLVVAAFFGLAWRQTRVETEALLAQIPTLQARAAALTQQSTALASDVVQEESQVSRDLRRVSFLLTPADRARPRLAWLFEQLRQTAAGRPPRAQLPPPPMGPLGNVFPELMGDPEYNHCYALTTRYQMQRIHGPALRALGLPPDKLDQVLGLLTERALLPMEFHSLIGSDRTYGAGATQLEAQQAEVEAQLRDALGPEFYERLCEDAATTRRNADGTLQTVTRRMIPLAPSSLLSGSLTGRLERRLSYHPEPLSAEQTQQLRELNAKNQLRPADQRYRMSSLFSDPRYVADVAPILSPAQRIALEELRAEAEAATRRSQLPTFPTPVPLAQPSSQ